MPQDFKDFDQINDHIEKTYVEFDEKSIAVLDKNNALSKLCGIYKVIRPILVAITKVIIIPKKWRNAIQTFISVMDIVCP